VPLGGKSRVEIVAVPDAEHVVVRREDGSELTLAFVDIREAVLVVDWETLSKRR
jgi:hypothetical protein